jgi:hypothetical protein
MQSASKLLQFNLSYFDKDYKHYLFEEELSPSYVDNYIRQTPPYSFEVGGTDYSRFKRNTQTFAGKLDWSTQLNKEINVQFGGEFKQHRIRFNELFLYPDYDNGVQVVRIPLPTIRSE